MDLSHAFSVSVKRSHWERWAQLRWLALLLLLAAAVRLAIAFWLVDVDGMWSIDGGTYLINRDAWLGIQHDVVMHARPPLAPGIVLYPFTTVLGDNFGLRAWSIAGSLLLIGASYYMARGFFDHGRALLVAAMVAADFWLLENMGAGALVLYALALLCVAVRGLLDWLYGATSHLRLVLMAVALGLLPYVNQTVAGLALLTLPALFCLVLWLRWKEGVGLAGLIPLPVAVGLAAAVVIALPSIQWYLPVAPGGDTVAFSGAFVRIGPGFFFEWFIAATWAIVLWVAYPLVRSEKWGTVFWALLVMMLPLMLLYSHDEVVLNFIWRSRYVASVAGAILVVGICNKMWPGWLGGCICLAVSGFVSAFLIVGWGTGLSSFSAFSKHDLSATAWIEQKGDGLPVVVDGWGRARLVAAMTGSKVYTLRAWNFPHAGYDDLPAAFRLENGVAFCMMGWADYLDGAACETRNLPNRAYIMVNTEFSEQEWIPDRHLDVWHAALEHTNALPHTKLVWQRGDVYVWEFDTEAAGLHPAAAPSSH